MRFFLKKRVEPARTCGSRTRAGLYRCAGPAVSHGARGGVGRRQSAGAGRAAARSVATRRYHPVLADPAGDARSAGGVPQSVGRRRVAAAEDQADRGGQRRPRSDRKRGGLRYGRCGRRAPRDQRIAAPAGFDVAGAAMGSRRAPRCEARSRSRSFDRCPDARAGSQAGQGTGPPDRCAGAGEHRCCEAERVGAGGVFRALVAHAGVPADRHRVLAGASGGAQPRLGGGAASATDPGRGGAAAGRAASSSGDRCWRDRHRPGSNRADAGGDHAAERSTGAACARSYAR